MPLEHYIGQFTAGKVMLFHHDIVPICANARENDPRRDVARQELSVCVPERNKLRVLHCNSSLSRRITDQPARANHRESACNIRCQLCAK